MVNKFIITKGGSIASPLWKPRRVCARRKRVENSNIVKLIVWQIMICLLLALMPALVSAKITAKVDRQIIEEGETFQLTILSDDAPDINALKRDFNVLGTAKSTKITMVNGSVNRGNELVVRLSPKRVGNFIIPAIRAGSHTSEPISIKVTSPTFSQAAQGEDFFLEANTDLLSVYVQSQIIYTIRLFRAVEIREGSLTEPDLPDAVVERLGEDVTFQTRRNGRLYQVTERRFAIFPQKSGEFVIAPTVFQGQALEKNNRQRINDPFDRFFQSQRAKHVRIKSEAVEVVVNPQPDDIDATTWLPAKRLILTESWSPETPQFKVGEPVTRTLRIEAEGLTAAQLPELKSYEVVGIKQYADQPTVNTVLQRGKLFGIREEKFAIVPTQSGNLVLPELRLQWWNTEMNRAEVIVIPPKIIDVAASAVTATTPPIDERTAVPIEDEMSAEDALLIGKEMVKTVVEAGYWPQVAIVAIVAWLLTSLGWLLYWRKNRVKFNRLSSAQKDAIQVSLKAASKQLKNACASNDAAKAKQALLYWASAAWPESASPSLSFLSEKLESTDFNQIIAELNQVLYASENASWDGQKFWRVASPYLTKPRRKSNKAINTLPGLYPQQG